MHCFVNIKIEIEDNCIKLSQQGYLEKILGRFATISTPLEKKSIKNKDVFNKNFEKQTGQIVGRVIYAAIYNRSDLSISILVLIY